MIFVSQLTGLCSAHLLYRQERWRGERGLSCGPSCQLSELRVYQSPGRVQGWGMGAATWHLKGCAALSQSQRLRLELRGDPEPSSRRGGWRAGGVGSVTRVQVCPDTCAAV